MRGSLNLKSNFYVLAKTKATMGNQTSPSLFINVNSKIFNSKSTGKLMVQKALFIILLPWTFLQIMGSNLKMLMLQKDTEFASSGMIVQFVLNIELERNSQRILAENFLKVLNN